MKSDSIIEVVDFRLIFHSSLQFPKPRLVGWIESLGRIGDARIVHVSEKLGAIDDQENPGWHAENDRLEADALREREDAVAKTIVNVSLAIRRALDRVAEHRESKSRKPTDTSGRRKSVRASPPAPSEACAAPPAQKKT